MKVRFFGVIAVAVTLISGPSAFAFQFVNPETNPDGSSNRFTTDLDQTQPPTVNNRFRLNDSGGNTTTSTLKFGNSTLQFGMSGGSNSNYGPSPALQDKFLQSPASRTVPSQGWQDRSALTRLGSIR